MAGRAGWNFDNSFTRLPGPLFARVEPTPVRAPSLVLLNRPLALELGLDPEALSGEAGAAVFSGNALPDGAEPLAQAYAGHQFGHFTMLGDGRALLLGEQIAPDGRRFDVQLKGSGPTPFSRGGDGRAALGPMLREYVVSEALHHLGLPTTRSLAVAATGEDVRRETILPGAVLTRVAASHIRVGTFEYLAASGEHEALLALAAHTLKRHYPELAGAENPALSLYAAAIGRQAALVTGWLLCGFIHGVMNTDNMALSGEGIDYGPCAFMDAYDPDTVFSSIDQAGRYAYGNQASMAQWNLARLGEALLPLLAPEPERARELAVAALGEFPARLRGFWLSGMRAKLGLLPAAEHDDGDMELAAALLDALRGAKADYHNSFRALCAVEPEQLPQTAEFAAWKARWKARLKRQERAPEASLRAMRAVNPAVIARNHKVEEALAAATDGDLAVLEKLLGMLARPFDDVPADSPYRQPAPASAEPYRTFCGT